MLKDMFSKIAVLESHHQIMFAAVVLVAVVLFSWGVEKIFEEYVFPKKYPLFAYIFAIVVGVSLFLLTKSILLDVM